MSITFEVLTSADTIGSMSLSAQPFSSYMTNSTGNIMLLGMKPMTMSSEGSALSLSMSLSFSDLLTDVSGEFVELEWPRLKSAFSGFSPPPVYILDSAWKNLTIDSSGFSTTTVDDFEVDIEDLTMFATDVSGAVLFSGFEFGVSRLGDIPPISNYVIAVQNSGLLYSHETGATPWAVITEELFGDAEIRADVGVTVVARAMATDGLLAVADFHKLAQASATVYAQLNQAWYGVIDAEATAALNLTEQVHYLASVFARCAADATSRSVAEMHLAITASVIALAGAAGKVVYPLVAGATANVDTNVVYGAVGQILDNLTATVTASRYAVFLVAAVADGTADATASAGAASFVNAIAYGSAYVRATFDGNDFEGWVLNTRPKGEEQIRGFTTYENFPFTSFANFAGKQYGASAEGVYELSGPTDDGNPIPAWVRTALFDLDSRRDKRMQTMYVGYTSDKRLVAKMITTTGGEKVETWYTMRAIQKADANREARIEVGKGLHSVYWGFELHNEDGADFSLDVVALWPVYLDRRVTNG